MNRYAAHAAMARKTSSSRPKSSMIHIGTRLFAAAIAGVAGGGVGTWAFRGLVLSSDSACGVAEPVAVKASELAERCGAGAAGWGCGWGRGASPSTWRVSALSGLKRRQFCKMRVRSASLAPVFAYQNQAEMLWTSVLTILSNRV